MHVCASATDTHCFVHWATWGEGGSPQARAGEKLVCVNPLNWQRDGGMAAKALNLGAEPITGKFTFRFLRSDAPAGTVFGPLDAPLKAYIWAECRNGFLTVADQSGTPFGKIDLGGENYHGLDYALSCDGHPRNAQARVVAYMKDQASRWPGAMTLSGGGCLSRRRKFLQSRSAQSQWAAHKQNRDSSHKKTCRENAETRHVTAGRILQPAHQIGAREARKIGERID